MPISKRWALRAPHFGAKPIFVAKPSIACVGLSQSKVARPVVPLPANVSSTVAPGSVWVAMNTAMASGEILVGYENALYNGPVRADGNGLS